jgi:hypothetical protein
MKTYGMAFFAIVSVAPLALGSGCVAETDPADVATEEDGLKDNAFAAGITEGSAEAKAVLQVANTLTFAALSKDVGLTNKLAANILARRAGDDGKLGTADDEKFQKLLELNAVPGISREAFQKLLAYAKSHGLVKDPAKNPKPASNSAQFVFATCGDAPKWPVVSDLKYRGPIRYHRQNRQCDSFGCAAWSEWTVVGGHETTSGLTLRAADHRLDAYLTYLFRDNHTCESAALSFTPYAGITLDDTGSAKLTAKYEESCSSLDYSFNGALSKTKGYTFKQGASCAVLMQDEPAPASGTTTRVAIVFGW